VWKRFTGLRQGTVNTTVNLRVPLKRKMSWLAEWLLASQEGFSSMDFAMKLKFISVIGGYKLSWGTASNEYRKQIKTATTVFPCIIRNHLPMPYNVMYCILLLYSSQTNQKARYNSNLSSSVHLCSFISWSLFQVNVLHDD